MESTSTEICLIDSGIQDLFSIPLNRSLQIINLHGNAIERIENLNSLQFLKHLDLSSNRITRIEGLQSLVNLRTLNLSCNVLRKVENLNMLKSLVKINLSYNRIDDISGFSFLSGPENRLSCIDISGNNLQRLTHVVESLSGIQNLRQLTLQQSGSSNPLCTQQDYWSKMLSGLPRVQILDNLNHQGQPYHGDEILADIPGLEDYMDYLLSNSSNQTEEVQSFNINTPVIDQVLDKYKRQQNTSSSDVSGFATTDIDDTMPGNSKKNVWNKSSEMNVSESNVSQDTRLKFLEDQLAHLIATQKINENKQKSSNNTVSKKQGAAQSAGKRDESDSDLKLKPSSKNRTRRSKIPNSQTIASRHKQDVKISSSSTLSDHDTTKSKSFKSSGVRPSTETSHHGSAEDRRQRNNIETTYMELMKQLEQERERRWKAEEAAMKLADHVKEAQTKEVENTELKNVAVEATTRLKQGLMNERESKIRLEDELGKQKSLVEELEKQLKKSQDTEESQKKALQMMESSASNAEKVRLQQQAHEQKKIQDSQLRAAAMTREAEMLRNTVDNQKGQIQQLQSLLAAREQEHREELKKRYSLESPQLQSLIDKEVKRSKNETDTQQKLLREKIQTLQEQYKELEDEFRLALQIEANRYKELEEIFNRTNGENNSNTQALAVLQKKEEKSSTMVTELTALVKEQKGRIAELSKSKQELNVEYKERIQTLESHAEEARKRMVQLEMLKQEKVKLQAQSNAQESVIEGLKSERRLWGQELAEQGASLAQDRGRLEAKIESLQSEVVTVKKHLERETDAVKIKTKMIEDQTESIRKLKEGIVERDEEIKKAREEALSIQRNLEAQLVEERSATQDNQDIIERLRERKEELKQQLSDIQSQLDESEKAHNVLNTRWKEKSELIGQLEKQVFQMKNSWEEKERKMIDERDKAIEAARIAIEKLKTADEVFRQQLDAKTESYRNHIEQLQEEKDREVTLSRHKVQAVEEEMRVLLRETDGNKRMMEDKIKRLNQAFSDLQTDLY